MKTTVKKLYKGHVSIRDYIIEKCKTKNEDLVIKYRKWVMTIAKDKLNKGKTLTRKNFDSKYNFNNYKVIDFKFKPDNLVK